MPEKTDYEEISFDPSFMDMKADDEEKIENLDFFNEDFLGINNEEKQPDEKTDELEEKEIDENNPSPNDIKDESSNLFSVVLGQDLVEKGILSSFDKDEIAKIAQEESEAAAIEYMLKKQTESINEDIKKNYDSAYQEYLTMVQGGVPKEEALGIQQLESFSNSLKDIDLKGEDEQSVSARKDLLTLHYRLSTKFSDEKIQKIVEKAYDEGTDLDEVDEALTGLNNYVTEEKQNAINAAEQAKINSQKSQEKWLNDLTKHIDSTDEYFQGIKVTKQAKDEIRKLIITPVKLDTGEVVSQIWAERAKDPIKFDAGIAYLKTIGFFDGKPLDKFMKVAQTKVTSKLDEFLNDNKGRSYTKGMSHNFSNNGKNKNEIDAALGLE
jgi:uncharacterized FlaG/YvyC family protein